MLVSMVSGSEPDVSKDASSHQMSYKETGLRSTFETEHDCLRRMVTIAQEIQLIKRRIAIMISPFAYTHEDELRIPFVE